MTDRRKKVTQVKCKCDESTMKQSIFVEYNIAIWKKCLSSAATCLQEKLKIL